MTYKLSNEFIVFLVINCGIFFFLYRNLYNIEMLNLTDMGVFSLNAQEFFESFFSAWVNKNLGYPGSGIESDFFNGLITFIIGNNGALAQRIFFLSLLPLSSIAMFALLRNLLNTNLAIFLGAIFYGINPLSIELFLGGSALLALYMFFPLLFLYFNLLTKNQRFRDTLIFTAILAIATGYNVQAPLIYAPVLIVHLIMSLKLSRPKYLIKSVMLILISFGFLILLVLPSYYTYISTLINYYTGASVELSYLPRPISSEYLMNRISSDIIQAENLQNMHAAWFLGSITIPALFIINRYYKKQVLITSVLLIPLITLFWSVYTQGQLMWLIKLFPFLSVIAWIKIILILSWGYSLLIPFLLDHFFMNHTVKNTYVFRFMSKFVQFDQYFVRKIMFYLNAYKKRHIAQSILNLLRRDFVRRSLVVSLILALFVPNFTYSITSLRNGQQFFSGAESLAKTAVPPVYNEVLKLINKDSEADMFRILWLPLDPSIVEIISNYFTRTTLYYDSDYLYPSFIQLYDKRIKSLGEVLSSVNVKYVIVNRGSSVEKTAGIWPQHGNPRMEPWGPSWSLKYFPVGDPELFIDRLAVQTDLKIIYYTTQFVIYENLKFVPLITIYSEPLELLEGNGYYQNANKFLPSYTSSQSHSSYIVRVNQHGPLYLLLSISYDSDWKAYANGQLMQKFSVKLPSHVANGFYINANGDTLIKIQYAKQELRNLILIIWGGSWLSLLMTLLYSFRDKFPKIFKIKI